MMQNKSLLLLLLSLLIAPLLTANGETPASIKIHSLTIYCPAPNALIKDPVRLTWSAAHHNFRSYDISFATRVKKFVGAQWVGAAGLGRVTCVYKTFSKTAFPILLTYRALVLEPQRKLGAWTKNFGGYRNCNSFNLSQCPFIQRKVKETKNIYEEAKHLKLDDSENE